MAKDRVSLSLEERNDVQFDVKITSTDQLGGPNGPNVQLRFICEADDFEYAFKGVSWEDGVVRVVVPPMKGVMTEGVYDARLEVVVEGRHFVPLKFEAQFKEPLKVVAEAVRVVNGSNQLGHKAAPVQVAATITNGTKQTKVTPRKSLKTVKVNNCQGSLADMDQLLKEL